MAVTVHYFLTKGSGPERPVTRQQYAHAEQEGFPTWDDKPQHMAFTVRDTSGRQLYKVTDDAD